MIFGASNHPVEVKKILLRLWSLRDEIELELSQRLAAAPTATAEEKEKIIREVTQHFTPHKATEVSIDPGQALKLVENPEVAEGAEGEEKAAEAEAAPATTPPAPKEGDPPAAATPEAEGAEKKAELSVVEANPAATGEEEASATIELRKRPPLAPEKLFRGILLLSDLNMQSIALFSTKSFIPGQNIVIEFDIPYSFVVSAEVISCRKYSMKSKIISLTRPDFRLFARFTFSLPGERTLLRNFVKSIEPTVPKDNGKKKKKKEAEGEGGGGDDLSDLGA